jgi:hypothetical protein
MENLSHGSEGTTRVTTRPVGLESLRPEDWHLARRAGLNLLLIDGDGVASEILNFLLQEMDPPFTNWRPGLCLVLPPETAPGTVVLHNVSALARDDQYRLLAWLEKAAGRAQVVSTTAEPLLPRVQSGTFLDTLYYRLNTVCVDAVGGYC